MNKNDIIHAGHLISEIEETEQNIEALKECKYIDFLSDEDESCEVTANEFEEIFDELVKIAVRMFAERKERMQQELEEMGCEDL